MDVADILAKLRLERDQIEQTILSLERLAGQGKRRGRPPAWMVAAQSGLAESAGRNRRHVFKETRASARQQKQA